MKIDATLLLVLTGLGFIIYNQAKSNPLSTTGARVASAPAPTQTPSAKVIVPGSGAMPLEDSPGYWGPSSPKVVEDPIQYFSDGTMAPGSTGGGTKANPMPTFMTNAMAPTMKQ